MAADDAARHGEGLFLENVVVGVLGAIPAPAGALNLLAPLGF
jgi:hypothetical protein